MRLIKRGFVLVLVLLTAVFLFVTLRDRRQTLSVHENRRLAAHPALTAQAVWDGSYFDGWDLYFSDHAAWRDEMMRDWLWLRLNAKRQVVVNDVVITREALLPDLGFVSYDGYDYDTPAREMAERLGSIRDAVEAYGGRFLYLGVDEQSMAFASAYPSYLNHLVAYYSGVERAFRAAAEAQGLPALFLRDLLPADSDPADWYSRVDHHFNLNGAYEAYAALCQWGREQGLELPILDREALNIHPSSSVFYGSYSRKLYDLSPIQERLLLFDPACLPAYTRWDYGQRTDAPLLTLPEEGAPVQYDAYMGGDIAETVIRTERPELPNILIVGDSFTNPVEALCVYSFNELRSLDFRYYEGMTLTEYLRDYPADLVVVIRDSLHYCAIQGNGDLR